MVWWIYLVGVCGTGREHRESLDVRRAHRVSRIAYVCLHLLLATGIIPDLIFLSLTTADVILGS